jgi:hypothetical protein
MICDMREQRSASHWDASLGRITSILTPSPSPVGRGGRGVRTRPGNTERRKGNGKKPFPVFRLPFSDKCAFAECGRWTTGVSTSHAIAYSARHDGVARERGGGWAAAQPPPSRPVLQKKPRHSDQAPAGRAWRNLPTFAPFPVPRSPFSFLSGRVAALFSKIFCTFAVVMLL